MKNILKKSLFALFLCVPLATSLSAPANEAGPPLDRAPINLQDKVSLQRGARTFVNYCLNCHSASYMRYSRLEDLGLTEDQIKDNLLLATDKIGDTMTTALAAKDGKDWFGAAPPDLSVVARSRSPDWLYTYLRSYYRDDKSPTGWNNEVFPNVAMPHVLHELQGTAVMQQVGERKDHEGKVEPIMKAVIERPGALTPREYDKVVGDLVNYLTYMGEPSQSSRVQIGIVALFLLTILFLVALWLKHEYWRDVK